MMIAKKIYPGNKYEGLFPYANMQNDLLSGNDVPDTVSHIKDIVASRSDDCNEIAEELKNEVKSEGNQLSTYNLAKKLYHFCYNYFQYKDDGKKELLRTPARAWKDRKNGIDCDCFTILMSCILNQWSIPHKARISDINGNGWQHIYVIATDEKGNKIIIDPTINMFNYEDPYKKKHDINMEIRKLSGPSCGCKNEGAASNFLNEFDDKDRQVTEAVKDHLLNSKRVASNSPEVPDNIVAGFENALEGKVHTSEYEDFYMLAIEALESDKTVQEFDVIQLVRGNPVMEILRKTHVEFFKNNQDALHAALQLPYMNVDEEKKSKGASALSNILEVFERAGGTMNEFFEKISGRSLSGKLGNTFQHSFGFANQFGYNQPTFGSEEEDGTVDTNRSEIWGTIAQTGMENLPAIIDSVGGIFIDNNGSGETPTGTQPGGTQPGGTQPGGQFPAGGQYQAGGGNMYLWLALAGAASLGVGYFIAK